MSVNTCFAVVGCAAFLATRQLFVEVRCGKFDSCASEDSDAVRRGCGPRAAGVGNFGAVPISHEIVQSGGCATYFDDHGELVPSMWRRSARTTAGGRRHHAGRPTAASPFRLGSGARAGRHSRDSVDDSHCGVSTISLVEKLQENATRHSVWETLSLHRLPSESASHSVTVPGGESGAARDSTVSDCANSDRDNDGARSGHDSGGQREDTAVDTSPTLSNTWSIGDAGNETSGNAPNPRGGQGNSCEGLGGTIPANRVSILRDDGQTEPTRLVSPVPESAVHAMSQTAGVGELSLKAVTDTKSHAGL